jgi:hypothetical protein
MVARFRYLKSALALVLIFIGSKIVVADLLREVPARDLARRHLRDPRRGRRLQPVAHARPGLTARRWGDWERGS